MWEIVSSGGLGHRWPTPNCWDKGEGDEEEEEELIHIAHIKVL